MIVKILKYPTLILTTIILGILSRKSTIIPLFVGDFLYAVMIYFFIRLLLQKLSYLKCTIISLLICLCIEISQLYQANWIIEIRETTLGHYVLGQTFLWSDLLAYTAGITTAYFTDKYLLIFKSKTK